MSTPLNIPADFCYPPGTISVDQAMTFMLARARAPSRQHEVALDQALGGVMAVAMVVNIIMAGLAGILIPVMLDKMDIDPALASSIFVTTITDVVGFFAFLGLAALVLL